MQQRPSPSLWGRLYSAFPSQMHAVAALGQRWVEKGRRGVGTPAGRAREFYCQCPVAAAKLHCIAIRNAPVPSVRVRG
jgi:hypothetical protein